MPDARPRGLDPIFAVIVHQLRRAMTATTIYAFSELLADGVVFVDTEGRIVHANAALLELLDYTADALTGRPLSVLIPEEHRDRHSGLVEEFRAGEVAHKPMAGRTILHALARHGRKVPVSISIAKVVDGDELRMMAILREIPAELSRFRVQAHTDQLTGAANRLHLSKRINELLEQRKQFGLLYLDLDRFKPINDAHGHPVGDQVLKIVVQRIQRIIRSEDLVARVGGDEFVVLVADIGSPGELEPIAQKIHSQIAGKMTVGDFEGSVTASIGCVNSPADGTVEKTLLKRADSAMYEAKKGGEGYRFHSASD